MPDPAAKRPNSVIPGMLLMTCAAFFLAAMHSLVRKLSGDLHPFEIVFFRNLFGLVAVTPLIVRAGRHAFRTYQPKLQIARGFNSITAMLLWFYALSIVPLAQATAMSFMAVVFASLGAVLFLGERMRARRWTAVAISFLGALIILRPATGDLDPGLIVVILSALSWGTGVVLVKQLSRTDTVVSIVATMAVMLTFLSLWPALLYWKTPTSTELLWLMLLGTLGTLGHLAMTRALSIADAGAIMPLDFTRLVWAALLGYVLFLEVPDTATLTGGAIIVAAATYIVIRESRAKHIR